MILASCRYKQAPTATWASRAFDKVRPALWRQSCELVAWAPRAASLPATLIRQAAVTKCWLVHEAAGAAGPTDCSACTTQGAIPASRPPGDRDWLISAKRHGELAGLGWNQRSQSRALATAAKLRCGDQVRTFRPILSRAEQKRLPCLAFLSTSGLLWLPG